MMSASILTVCKLFPFQLFLLSINNFILKLDVPLKLNDFFCLTDDKIANFVIGSHPESFHDGKKLFRRFNETIISVHIITSFVGFMYIII